MCAIAGGIGIREEELTSMLEELGHRGPDDKGTYYDPTSRVSLGHCRLAIIDLSPTGHQPMLTTDESLSVVFNGEIYNYQELTNELRARGCIFHSSSDTEVILHGYREFGENIFRKIDGMWSIALYDRQAGKLFLSRDPAGIKPLYTYQNGTTLLFSSEIRALAHTLPAEARSIKAASIDRFLVHGYLYGIDTIYNEISQVPAGTLRTYTLPMCTVEETTIFTPQKQFVPRNMSDAVTIFNELFAESVRAVLQADVPVGLFLSGGIDSSLAGYHIKAAGAKPTAFTVGFEEQDFDESPVAARIAQHLGFPHITHMMRGSDVAADIEHILDAFGQPFADTSVLPTYYISKLAREHGIKVAIGGDGADELFGGYPTHYLPPFAEIYRRTPVLTDTALSQVASFMPGQFTKLGAREKLTLFIQAARNPYTQAHAKWKNIFSEHDRRALVRGMTEETDVSFDTFFEQVRAAGNTQMDEVMKVDFLTFLQGSCLVKSDIASMQHGLEIRVPFLNKDIIDFAWYLPTEFKTGPFSTKRILREALALHLPKEITRIRKQGFVPPLAHWLTGELKPAMLRILSEEQVAASGFLEYKYIVSLIEDHLSRRADHSKKIWALMSLVRFLNANA